jgi:hypothetical protein
VNRKGDPSFRAWSPFSIPATALFLAKSKFLVLSNDHSVRNLKFLAGNVIANGDTNSVAQRPTKELSMALYAPGAL